MTKPLVQGQIGYWVDGNLVHMPKRKKGKVKKVDDHVKRNIDRKTELIARRLQQDRLVNAARERDMRVSSLIVIEPLKNASKSGRIASVLHQLHVLSQSWFKLCGGNNKGQQQQPWTTFIFFPDSEERTALYYASLTGHANIVELYMCLYLMSCVRITKSTCVDSRTFREWFSTMRGTSRIQLPKKFTLEDYDLCILNALNDPVKKVLNRKKVTIADAMDFVKECFNSSNSENPSQQQLFTLTTMIDSRIKKIKQDILRVTKQHKKQSKRPQLKIDDGVNYVDEDSLDLNNDYEEDKLFSTYPHRDECHEGCVKNDEVDQVSFDDVSKVGESKLCDDLSFISHEQTCFEWGDFEKEFDSISLSNGDGTASEDYDLVSQYSRYTEEEQGMSQSWDVVSEVQSVKSIDSFSTNKCGIETSSSTIYRDALIKNMKPISNDIQRKAKTLITKKKKETKKMSSISETDDQDILQDAHWDRDAYKNTRGGKVERFFTGNGRTQTQNHYGFLYCTRQRERERETRDVKTRCRNVIK